MQGSLGTIDRQTGALRVQARSFAQRFDTGSVATVSWIGYEIPQWDTTWRPSRSVATREAAQRGAADLSVFLNGIDAARDTPVHLTALGHSYGSLTTGLALQRHTGVDDAVAFGSPGLDTSDVSDLKVRPGHTFVVEARKDAVADVARFGTDPNQLDGVTQLSASEPVIDGVRRKESTGHSAYDRRIRQHRLGGLVEPGRDHPGMDDGRRRPPAHHHPDRHRRPGKHHEPLRQHRRQPRLDI